MRDQPPAETAPLILIADGELLEAISKYGRKYGWQRRVLNTEFVARRHEIGVSISSRGRLRHEIRPGVLRIFSNEDQVPSHRSQPPRQP